MSRTSIRNEFSLKREVKEILLVFTFGGIVNLAIWGTNFDYTTKIFYQQFFISGLFWTLLWKGSQYLVWGLDSVLPWVDYPIKRLVASITSVVVYVTLVVYFLDIAIDMILFEKTFKEAILKINQTSLTITILITLGINTIMHGRGFLLSWRQTSIDMEKLKTEHIFTQFQSLKNQVNPHFLFNSLNALSSLVYEDQDKAVEFIRKLSQVYRYVLEKKEEEAVPIADEISFLENFVYLQKIRFGDNLNIDIKQDQHGGFLPPLALQLLVENAIKHNVISDSHPLTIKVELAEGFCTVSNNKKEKLEKDSTGIGLRNLRDRYRYLADKEVELTSDDEHFTVRIPILQSTTAFSN